MGVAESVDAQSGDEIQVAIPFPVEQVNSLAALEGDGIAVVGGQQEMAFALNNFVGDGHIGEETILSESGVGVRGGVKTPEPLRARSTTKVMPGFLRAPRDLWLTISADWQMP